MGRHDPPWMEPAPPSARAPAVLGGVVHSARPLVSPGPAARRPGSPSTALRGIADVLARPWMQAWGLLEAETGNVFGARRLFEACLQEVPHDPASLVAYARTERLFGALDVARTLLKRATYMDPRHQPAWTVSPATAHAPQTAGAHANHAALSLVRPPLVQAVVALACCLACPVVLRLTRVVRWVWQEWSLLEQQAGRPQAAADLLERARAVPAPKGPPAAGERRLGEAGSGRGRHRKGPRRKEVDLQVGSSADAVGVEGRSRLSFEASVQALKDSFRPSTTS